MRHSRHKNRLGVKPSHRKSMIKNLACELIDHGQIKTTIARARATKIYVEKLVTLAKKDTVHNRRLAFSRLNNKAAVGKLFTEVGPKFTSRPGGYTRLMRLPDGRVGDGAKLGIIAFVE